MVMYHQQSYQELYIFLEFYIQIPRIRPQVVYQNQLRDSSYSTKRITFVCMYHMGMSCTPPFQNDSSSQIFFKAILIDIIVQRTSIICIGLALTIMHEVPEVSILHSPRPAALWTRSGMVCIETDTKDSYHDHVYIMVLHWQSSYLLTQLQLQLGRRIKDLFTDKGLYAE